MGTILGWLAAILAGLAWFLGWLGSFLDWLKQYKDGLGGLQSIVTIAATLIGAWWAIRRFGWTREGYARANVDATVACKRLNDTATLVCVSATIENKGTRRVSVWNGWVEVLQVLPLAVAPAAGGGLLEAGRRRVRWPVLAGHRFEGGKIVGPDPKESKEQRKKNETTTADLDPGERDVMTFEFVIPADVAV